MTTADSAASLAAVSLSIPEAVESACQRIAPTWPLDRSIAVNPYWGFLEEPIQTAANRIESYSGSRMVMPRSYYRGQWKAGLLCKEHLLEALLQSGLSVSIEELLQHLDLEPPSAPRIPLFTSIADTERDLLHGMSICDFVAHNLSQHCASYFDHCQSSWETQHKNGLYRSWMHHARTDMSPWLLMGIHNLRRFAGSLPDEPLVSIEQALQALPVPPEEYADYLTALLMSIHGWASWCAFERWQAQLDHAQDDHIVQLLAIRLAWEHFAFVHLLGSKEPPAYQGQWAQLLEWRQGAERRSAIDWIFQQAIEIAYQKNLCGCLQDVSSSPSPEVTSAPDLQAIFCIDVRSEVFRRALEACSDSIQTLGFAGFFGLPIAYAPLGTTAKRPQLPGLLAPQLEVCESAGSLQADREFDRKKRQSLLLQSIWKDFRSSATSTFTFVEACGLFYAASLLKRTLPLLERKAANRSAKGGSDTSLRPCLSRTSERGELSMESQCELVANILTQMSLTANFARLVLVAGHGSRSLNNPHAAGLECGACGGQSGEVNARVLAGLLNDSEIRKGLSVRGIEIPADTHFLAALHNTATDEVTLFDTDLLPHHHAFDLARIKDWLEEAGHRARIERARSLGIETGKSSAASDLLHRFQIRSQDWSQVRPEWGLANNAALLIAPRARSRSLNLEGRVFLHEYFSGTDRDGGVLEAIMTAPMLVANWINMQYYASTVDNRLFGSGNKVLHNVVGGNLGVFEGNGGDLRIGLPLQSLHDGHRLRHTPLRLSVVIEASQSSIHVIIERHQVLRHLIHNSWIHLFQISPGSHLVSRYRSGTWEAMEFNARAVPEAVGVAGPESSAHAANKG